MVRVIYIKLSFRLGQTAKILRVDKEDDAGSIREVISPKATGLDVTAKVIGGETNITNTELLRSYLI